MSFNILARYQEVVEQLPGYEPRPAQARMVEAVFDGLKDRRHCVVEAGTGSGKSFGYLIPALYSGMRPIVLSTGTIALQEQLMEKDIPFVLKATGMEDLSVRLVKGRRNYLCIQKLQEFERSIRAEAPERLYLNIIKSALQDGWNGDKAMLDFEIPTEIWEEMQSDSEDCLGRKCIYYDENPYRKAREDLDKADILVVNHALYLQDLMAGQALLPPHQAVIFDEAHHLKSFALRSFTARVGKYATNKLLRKIDRRLARVPEAYQDAIYQTESEIFQWLFRKEKSVFKIFPDETFYRLVRQQVMVLNDLRDWLADFDVSQQQFLLNELDQDRAVVQRDKLLNQLDGLVLRWELFLSPPDAERVTWAEVNADRLYYEIKSTPLNIAEQLSLNLWNDKCAVLTSATLAIGQKLTFLREQLGLPQAGAEPDLLLDSPFDFVNQCELYLPVEMPDPNDLMFMPAAVDEIVRILKHSQGRAFVLFTSYAAMENACAAVVPQVPYPCKMQGDLPKNRLIDWFKQTPNSVLFATASFWEGIDIPGEALSCVIIDRIPFAQPDDPIHSATVDRMKRMGIDWFNQYVLPEAVIRLKQGFGRLIRSRKDRGLVAILDPRLKSKGYGQKILRSLPSVRVIRTLAGAKSLVGNK